MKEDDVFEEFVGYSGDITKVFDKLDPASKVRALARMNQIQKAEEDKRQKLENAEPKKLPEFYSVKEAARQIHVSEQTIHNWKNSGKIKYRKIGGSIRFTYDDLMMYCLKFEPNLAVCQDDNIYIDKETHKVVPFEKDKIYKIINENKIWITLFSMKWEQAALFSRKRFGKFFSVAEDWQIDQIKFNLNDLS